VIKHLLSKFFFWGDIVEPVVQVKITLKYYCTIRSWKLCFCFALCTYYQIETLTNLNFVLLCLYRSVLIVQWVFSFSPSCFQFFEWVPATIPVSIFIEILWLLFILVLNQLKFCDAHCSAAPVHDCRDAFPLRLSRLFPMFVETANSLLDEVKLISSGGLNLPASHFASVNHTNALRIYKFFYRVRLLLL